MKHNHLHTLLYPRSIAIVGASNRPLKMGTLHALSIQKDGFKGSVYHVHHEHDIILGHKAYKAVSDLPEAPDVALLVVASDKVCSYLDEFGKIGTKTAIIITAGFKEIGKDGEQKEQELIAIAKHHGMRFLGPNCMGVINTDIGFNTTVHPIEQRRGMLGMVSQSGTYITQTLYYLQRTGIRFSKAVSVGNEASINLIDVLEYLGQDEQTKAIALYIESIRDIPRFLTIARKITHHKPILAQYVGGSVAGARSSLSHTGAMAGPNHLYEGIFKQAGILRVYSIQDLYGYGWMLASQPPLKGKRIGIVTNSGGPGSAIADRCETNDLAIPTFSNELQEKIRPIIPTHAASGNPVDLTFVTDISILTSKVPEIILKSGEVDGLILHGTQWTGALKVLYDHLRDIINNISLEDFIAQFDADTSISVRLPFLYNIPVAISTFFDRTDNFVTAFHANNIPVFDSPEKAATAMGIMLKFKNIRERKPYQEVALPQQNNHALEIISKARDNGQIALDEYHSKRLLALYGIPVSHDRLVKSEKELETEIARIPFPIAVKVCDHTIMHKTEKGLVYLNIKTDDDAINAYQQIQSSVGRPVPVILSEMINGAREFMAGMIRQKGFGPCIVFGLGGVYTEVFNDTTYRLCPLSFSEAEEMICDIKSQKILGPFRGMPAVDSIELAELLVKISGISILHPEIAEIDLNPIIIDTSHPIVADSLVILRQD